MKKFIFLMLFLLAFTGCGGLNQTIEQRKDIAELCNDLDLEVKYNSNLLGNQWVTCR